MKRLYRVLLRLYPAGFREAYAAPMERHFSDEYREVQGWRGRVRLSLRALLDLARTVPAEIARELRQDLRYATRVYRRRSLTTVLALATLALAIGATTGIFSVLNALLIRSLPFQEPERLVEVWLGPVSVGNGRPAFQAWRDSSPYLCDAAGYTVNEMNLGLANGSARVQVAETTANFLQMLGTEPEFGRGFAADEDIPGRNAVAVIGHGLWQRLFGGERSALGSTIRLNGVPLTVIGIAPLGLDYPDKSAIWTPTVYDLGRIPKAGAFSWQTIGRLKPNVILAQASAMFRTEVRRDEAGKSFPQVKGFARDPQLFSLRDRLAGPVRPASLVLMGLVIFVLLIACANVAHLLLSRTTERRQELALRAALGANRARLIQQLVTEAIVLTAAAALAGLMVAHWVVRLVESAQPAQLAARQYTVLDWRVIAFATGLAVLTGVVFGVLPVSLICRMQPGHEFVRAQQGSGSSGSGRMRGVLVGMQAALTVVLVAGAISMGRSFLKLVRTDLAFHTDRIVTLNVSLSGTRYEKEGRERQYYRQALEQLRSVHGVESVAAVSHLPLISKMFMGAQYKLDSGEQAPAAVVISASPGYFRAMATEVIEGREFFEADRQETERVVIVSDEFERAVARRPLIGRKINLAWDGAPTMATIIGVVRAERYAGPLHEANPQVFLPIEQSPPGFVTFVAKTRGNPEQYLGLCRDAVQRTDRDVPVYDVKTLNARLADTLVGPRFYTSAILFFAVFALLLAMVSTYGVATQSIVQRTHEIGVRMAVGAAPGRIRRTLLRQSMLPVGVGMLAGVLGAAGLSGLLRHLIVNVESTGLWICAAAASVLICSTVAAVWTATDRIVRMDPTAALRAE